MMEETSEIEEEEKGVENYLLVEERYEYSEMMLLQPKEL